MRKLLLPIIFFALLLPALASAAPIPELKETAPYKNLRTYVAFLGGVQEATSSEKESYAATLSARVQLADAKVLELKEQRENRLQKNYRALLRKRYAEVDRRADKRSGRARADAAAQQRKAEALLRKTEKNIRASYARQLRPLVQRVSQLKKQKAKSKDPREQALLAEEISLLQRKIARIRGIINSDIAKARSEHDKSVANIKRKLASALDAVNRQRKIERKETLRAWESERKTALLGIADKRRVDAALVRELRVRGEENLDAIVVVAG